MKKKKEMFIGVGITLVIDNDVIELNIDEFLKLKKLCLSLSIPSSENDEFGVVANITIKIKNKTYELSDEKLNELQVLVNSVKMFDEPKDDDFLEKMKDVLKRPGNPYVAPYLPPTQPYWKDRFWYYGDSTATDPNKYKPTTISDGTHTIGWDKDVKYVYHKPGYHNGKICSGSRNNENNNS